MTIYGKAMAAVVAAVIALCGASAAEAPVLAALASLQPGLWVVRARTPEGPPPQQLCLGNPVQLLQLAHRGQPCRRFVVTDDAAEANVTYTCGPGNGGRSDLRVETPRVAQIDAQGFIDGTPFAWTLEARRVGECRSGDRARPISYR